MNIKILAIWSFIYLTFLFFVLPVGADITYDNSEKTDIASIMRYMQKNFPDNDILYNIVPRGVVISGPVSELFEDEHLDIKSDAKDFLNRFGKIIKYINKPCVIEGNALTQKDSDNISNLELSIMRADMLVEFFIKNSGVLPDMLRGIGFGDMAPFDDNVSYKEHLNRRIDFVILNYEWGR